jgi:UDP:flavonoid glycosyltransferase YjiC (YdhE family)
VTAAPLKLKELLPGANATVSYGSHGYVAAALMAGVPCVVLPTDVEKAVLARHVVQLGAGVAVNVNQADDQLRPELEAVLGDSHYRDGACTFAQRHAAHHPERLPGRIAAAINEIAIHS